MAKSYSTAYGAAAYLDEPYRRRSNWYAGITNNPEARLFDEHAVDEERGTYAWVECRDVDVARETERLLHGDGYGGGPGGGNRTSVFVYVYEITDETCEDC